MLREQPSGMMGALGGFAMGRRLLWVFVLAGLVLWMAGLGCQLIAGLGGELPLEEDAGADGQAGGMDAGVCKPKSTAPCYSGLDGTRGVGACVAGVKNCNAEGTGYGACEGEVVPAAEACANPADEDCDGHDCVLWAKLFGDASEQSVRGLAVDGQGNVIIAGDFTGTLAFDPAKPISANGVDIYLAKFDPEGKPLWSKSFAGDGNPHVTDVAVDVLGNVILAGTIDQSITLGGKIYTAGGYASSYAAKFSPDGDLLWVSELAFNDYTVNPRLAVDTSGNVAVFGVDGCGACNYTSTFWLRKFHPNGTLVWAKGFMESPTGDIKIADRTVGAVAFDPFGNVLITGAFVGVEDFGGSTLTSAGGNDVFLAKFDATGAHVWSARYGDGAEQLGTSIAADAFGNVFVLGNYYGSMKFSGAADKLVSLGKSDIFVAKFSSAQTYLWSKSFGNAGDQYGAHLSTDKDGNVAFTGWTAGPVDFGGGSLAGGGSIDLPLVKLDPKGAHLWSKVFGDGQDQFGWGVAFTPSGQVLLVGDVRGAVDVGAGDLKSAGGADILVGKFAP